MSSSRPWAPRACAPPAAEAWRMSHSTNNFVALDPGGHDVGRWPVTLPDPIKTLVDELHNRPLAALALPDKLSDDLLAPLVRSELRCELVVRDPTLIQAAPVYLKAWEKGGGSVHVVEPVRLLAVATNPINDSGPDADAHDFRDLVADTLDRSTGARRATRVRRRDTQAVEALVLTEYVRPLYKWAARPRVFPTT